MKNAKPLILFVAKLLVSAGLLAFFFSQIDFKLFLTTLAAADLSYIAVALLVYLVAQVVAAARWTALARPLGFKTRLSVMTGYYFIGMFFNLFAPGTVGGDLSKIYYLARDDRGDDSQNWTAVTLHSTISVLADRAIGLLILIWLGALGLALFPQYAVPSTVRSVTFALALGLVVGGLALPLLTRILPENGRSLMGKLRIALASYSTALSAILLAVVFSVALHLIQAWMHVIMGKALAIEIPFSYCVILYPLVGTFAALPVSFNGIGLRESGYLFLLAVIGINSEKAIAFGLLLFLIVVLDSLLGGLLFLLKKSPKPPRTMTTA